MHPLTQVAVGAGVCVLDGGGDGSGVGSGLAAVSGTGASGAVGSLEDVRLMDGVILTVGVALPIDWDGEEVPVGAAERLGGGEGEVVRLEVGDGIDGVGLIDGEGVAISPTINKTVATLETAPPGSLRR